MPPKAAIEGKWKGPDGKLIKVEPLSDEDRRTLVRWIDLGCPIDLDYNPAKPNQRGKGWMLDDNRPVLTITEPAAGPNSTLNRILIGVHDYYTGLDMDSFQVTADFPLQDIPTGQNLAPKFQHLSQGVYELKLTTPITQLKGQLKVSIKDNEGNLSEIVRDFSVSRNVATK